MADDDATHDNDAAAGLSIDWPAELEKHARWLRTVLLARLGDPTAVDDVMQDVHLSAVERGHALRDASKVAPWLYRVAVASALAYRRRIGRQKKLLNRYMERSPPRLADARTIDPLDWLLAAERRELVRRALSHLPRRESEILFLKYTEDWTYQQIAEHLGLSESAVEARLHRARRRLRQALAALESPAHTPSHYHERQVYAN
jgi:RNA polymerase sigma-70 factor (ECF subfamily)